MSFPNAEHVMFDETVPSKHLTAQSQQKNPGKRVKHVQIKDPERCHLRSSSAFIINFINFQHISHLFLVFLLFTLIMYLFARFCLTLF